MPMPSTVYTSDAWKTEIYMGVGSVGRSVWLLSSVRADPSRWWCPFFSRAVQLVRAEKIKTERSLLGILFILLISSLLCLFFFWFCFFGPSIRMSRDFILDLSLLSRSDLSNNISTAKRAPWCWAYTVRVKENVFFKPECSDTVVCSSGVHRYRKHGL